MKKKGKFSADDASAFRIIPKGKKDAAKKQDSGKDQQAPKAPPARPS